MGFREWTNKHPRVAGTVVSVALVACIGVIVLELRSGRHRITSDSPEHYFTVDEGKTFFAFSGNNIPPFDYNGQVAVRAYVYNCGGRDFVGYIERYTPAAREIVASGKSIPLDVEWFGRELKRPGDSVWVSSKDHPLCAKITSVKCPDGHDNKPMAVEPNF